MSWFQRMSEEFIEEFANRVNWYYVSTNQELSEEFIKKHADKLHIPLIFSCHLSKLSVETREYLNVINAIKEI